MNTNPFSAAIDAIESSIAQHYYGKPIVSEMESAIRVLNAAGKIPRHLFQKALDHMPGEFLTIAEWKLVNDLSTALPDPDQAKEEK